MRDMVQINSWRRWRLGLAMACLAGFAAMPLSSIAQPPKDAGQSIDDALLEDLDNELLEGVGDLKKPAREKPAADKPLDGKPADDAGDPRPPLDAAIDGEDVGMPSADRDPLGYISQEMRQVERLIAEQEKRPHAEELQRRIVDDLARLIDQAEKQRQQQSSSSQNQNQQQTAKRQSPKQSQQQSQKGPGKDSSQPASDSTDRLGRAEQVRPDPELLRGLMKDAWGHLPERDREQMKQMAPERFLPQYELMIERYYRRLAEERSP